MNKRGQVQDVIYFAGLAVATLIVGVVIYFLFSTMLTRTATAISPIDNVSATALTYGNTTLTNFWDIILVIFLFFNVLLLFFSAFLIDIHPAFLVVYIIGAFVLVLLMPTFQTIIGKFYDAPTFSASASAMPSSVWFYNNFQVIVLAIIFITAIILFAKWKFGSGGQSSNPYRVGE